jgi:hypothetical protein
MKAWMVEMPSLQRFELDGTRLCTRAYRGWIHIFDAIRNHPKGMYVNFDQIIMNCAAEVSLGYNTDNFERLSKEKEGEEPWEDINRSLALYVSGKIVYNKSLRMWLEDE